MIKTVPTKVFNEGVDKWLKLANGEEFDIQECSYCVHYNDECAKCPLSIVEKCGWYSCCGGLYNEYSEHEAPKIASRIADFIISRCVYEVEG